MIYFFETNEQDQKDLQKLLVGLGFQGQIKFLADKLDLESSKKFADAEAVSVFVNSVVSAQVLAQLPKLKFIATRSTGFDHIDLAAAKAKKVLVANVPAYGSRTVAEFAFGLILALSRKVAAAYRKVKDNHDFGIAEFEGFDLNGKILGVVGTGRIGKNAIQIAKGFNMTVLGFDLYPNSQSAKELGFSYASLNELLNKADIVTLHVPYNKDTHHLINMRNLDQFKQGALLINTSRGEVADTNAILAGLKSGRLAGAGLDVIEGERDLKDDWHLAEQNDSEKIKMLLTDHILMDLPNVVLTPHIAFFSKEAKAEILKISAENIMGFIVNKPTNLVN